MTAWVAEVAIRDRVDPRARARPRAEEKVRGERSGMWRGSKIREIKFSSRGGYYLHTTQQVTNRHAETLWLKPDRLVRWAHKTSEVRFWLG